MHKIIVSVLLLCVLASVSFAGGMSSRKPIYSVEPYSEPLPIETARPIKTQIIEKETIKELVKGEKSRGFAIGFHGAVPEISYKLDNGFEAGIGYTKANNDQSGLIRVAYRFYESDKGWTELKIGAAGFPGTDPNLGLYLEAEQYISAWTSLLGTIYPVRTGTITNLSEAFVGARLYF